MRNKNNNNQTLPKKRLLSLKDTKKKVTKLHPARKMLNRLNVTVEKANMGKIKAKKDELEELEKSSEDIHLRSHELDIMEKKVDQEIEKAKREIKMLKVQQKAELLLMQKNLQGAGVPQAEIRQVQNKYHLSYQHIFRRETHHGYVC